MGKTFKDTGNTGVGKDPFLCSGKTPAGFPGDVPGVKALKGIEEMKRPLREQGVELPGYVSFIDSKFSDTPDYKKTQKIALTQEEVASFINV